jgi:phospholipid/cholesterol/gamma-HCH transport system substrate-binding protein
VETRSPGRGQIALMALFALSCFGLLLFLWHAFGGPVPFEGKGYRFTARFTEATQLSQQADVRISGVTVGKVISTEAQDGRTATEIEIDAKYAPIPKDSRAILRQKTLLGETYVELTPGSPNGPKLPEGGTLSDAQIKPTVQLDEILRAFDPKTRADLRRWLVSWSASLKGRGRDISDSLGNLPAATENGTDVLSVLDRQDGAVTRLVSDGAEVFGALGRRQDALRTLITQGDRVLATTAARDTALTDTMRILPTFLRELRPTLDAAEATSDEAAPTVRALEPVAPLVPPALRDLSALSPDARRLFLELDPLIARSKTALPALTKIVQGARPLVQILWPTGRELSPVVDYLGLYKQEVATMFANIAASSQAGAPPTGTTNAVKYIRTLIPITNEGFVTNAKRLPSNRYNPYLRPRGLDDLAGGLAAYSCDNVNNPGAIPGLGSPPCRVQGPFTVDGKTEQFPRLTADPK